MVFNIKPYERKIFELIQLSAKELEYPVYVCLLYTSCRRVEGAGRRGTGYNRFISFLPGPGEIMNPLSQLPSVDRLLSTAALTSLADAHGRAVVTNVVRDVLAAARAAVKDGAPLPDEAGLLEKVGAGVTAKMRPRLRPVFNLTGTVLHTNLGRAPLPEEAVQALVAAARSPDCQ